MVSPINPSHHYFFLNQNVSDTGGVDVKRRMKMIHSIFIYSVQATAPADLNALADITSLISREDPLKVGGRLGMILNGDVKVFTPLAPYQRMYNLIVK